MAEARNLKQREYNTNVYGHENTTPSHNWTSTRETNTFKSQAFTIDADPRATAN